MTDLLDQIGQDLEGSAVALTWHDFAHNRGFIYCGSGYNDKFRRSYALDYARQNPWLARESDYRPSGRIHFGEDLVPESALLETEFYTGWLHPQDLHHRLCAVVSQDRATTLFLEVMRSRQQGQFHQSDIERCRFFLPHLQRLLRMHHRIGELEIERNAALHALDRLPWGVVLVSNHGTRLMANRRAEEILRARDGLTICGSTLRAILPDEAARLDRLLASTLQGTRGGGMLSITRPSGGLSLNVLIVPLYNTPEVFGDQVRAVAVFVSDPEMRVNSNEQHLREVYALTAVEARLAAWLVRGESIEQAANAMGVTVNTARAYLKRIFHKTGVHRQSALVRLLLLGIPDLSQKADSTTK